MKKHNLLFATFFALTLSLLHHSIAVAKQADQPAVLVTGATSGIGKRIAETLAQRGVFVFAGARKQSDIDALSRIENMQGIKLDVTKPADIEAAVDHIRKSSRGLDGLVNNAGVFLHAPLIEVSESDMQFIMDVNMFGPYRISKAFAPLIIESKGRITTIGSIAGLSPGALFGPYAMSKGALQTYTDALARELSKFDVQVSIVDPGNFRSDIMQNMKKRTEDRKALYPNSLYHAEFDRLAGFTEEDRSRHAEPTPVAEAVYDALFSDAPKVRYMVTPNQREASMVMGSMINRLVQMNYNHDFSLTRDELVNILDDRLQAISGQN